MVVSTQVHLVRHGRSLVDSSRPPDRWRLDPAGLGDIDALRETFAFPEAATWFSSPEPKALETARRLTDAPVTVVDGLAEHRRGVHWFDSQGAFRDAVRRAFASPDTPAVPEWEPLVVTRVRLLDAVRRILAEHRGEVVLVGHGTAWTVLAAALTGTPPDLDAWERLKMPDVWTVGTSGGGLV